jgi:hypothetical protein
MHVDPDDFLSSIPEPDTGIFPEEFDREVLFCSLNPEVACDGKSYLMLTVLFF